MEIERERGVKLETPESKIRYDGDTYVLGRFSIEEYLTTKRGAGLLACVVRDAEGKQHQVGESMQ